MSVAKYFYYEPRVFRAGELTSALEAVLASEFPPEHAVDVALFRTLPDGTEHSSHQKSLEALVDLCDLSTQGSASVAFGRPLNSLNTVAREVELRLATDRDSFLQFHVSALDAQQLARFSRTIEVELALTPASTPSERKSVREREVNAVNNDAMTALEHELRQLTTRLEVFEQRQRISQRLTCFLSFQFSGASAEYARIVKRFLELVDVNVVTGQGYEPRQIQEKVRQRIRTGIDFVVVIEVAERKSSWTRDEIAVTQAPGVFLIPVIEDGAQFDQGIYGDHEYLTFSPGHVSDTFVGLLEGIEYVRAARASETIQTSAGESAG